MLSNKAMLVHLNISQWTGRKLDKRATGTVETSHSTERDVGNYTKKLLPNAPELQNIQRITNAMRQFFYEQTLPWCTDGSRIISSKNYLDFTAAYRVRKDEFQAAVSDFLREYPVLREKARLKLGDLFRETEYPTTLQLSHAFNCEIAFMPMPDVRDFRTEILDSEKESFLARMKDVEQQAMRDVWRRLYDVVSRAASKLQDKQGIFRDSLIENIHEMCGLLPKLNVMDDPQLESMRVEVERIAAGISADDCRKVSGARLDAARQLDAVTAKMSAFMGGAK